MKMVKSINLCGVSFVAIVLSVCVSSCGKPSPSVKADKAIILELNSGEGISKSIALITDDLNAWNQMRFDSINSAINSLAAADLLNKNINQDKKLWGELFTASAACLERKVDNIFKRSVYSGYSQMNQDLKFLQRFHKLYLEVGVDIDEENKQLDHVADIFAHYNQVLQLSRSLFGQKAVYQVGQPLKKYMIESGATKKKIENDKYYGLYFKHNKEIVGGVEDFPNRIVTARKNYYKNLAKKIQEVGTKDSLSYAVLSGVQTEFYNLATGMNAAGEENLAEKARNSEAIDALNGFVDAVGEQERLKCEKEQSENVNLVNDEI